MYVLSFEALGYNHYMNVICFACSGDNLDRHVLTHSFPTRRSSDLCLIMPSSARALSSIAALPYFKAWTSACSALLRASKASLVSCWLATFLCRSEEHTSNSSH